MQVTWILLWLSRRIVWHSLVLAVCICTLNIAHVQARDEGNMVKEVDFLPPEPVADFQFKNEAGKTLKLSDFKGKPLIVNLWATWCAPCVHEMPGLSAIQEQFAQQGLQVLAISQDFNGLELVRSFYQKQGITNLPIYLDPKLEILSQINAKGIPATLFIDKNGKRVAQISGAIDWHSTGVLNAVKQLAGEVTRSAQP